MKCCGERFGVDDILLSDKARWPSANCRNLPNFLANPAGKRCSPFPNSSGQMCAHIPNIQLEDTKQESPAQDPSLSICHSLTSYNLPRHLDSQRTTSLSVFGDAYARAVMSGAHLLIAVMCFPLSIPLSETAQSCDIHALRGSSSGANEKC